MKERLRKLLTQESELQHSLQNLQAAQEHIETLETELQSKRLKEQTINVRLIEQQQCLQNLEVSYQQVVLELEHLKQQHQLVKTWLPITRRICKIDNCTSWVFRDERCLEHYTEFWKEGGSSTY